VNLPVLTAHYGSHHTKPVCMVIFYIFKVVGKQTVFLPLETSIDLAKREVLDPTRQVLDTLRVSKTALIALARVGGGMATGCMQDSCVCVCFGGILGPLTLNPDLPVPRVKPVSLNFHISHDRINLWRTADNNV
jgi:hypothetical protein